MFSVIYFSPGINTETYCIACYAKYFFPYKLFLSIGTYLNFFKDKFSI